MLIVYKFNDIIGEFKATGAFYNEDKNEYHNYHKNYNDLITVDKDISYYDSKISLFEEFVKLQTV